MADGWPGAMKGTLEYEDVILPINDISLKNGAFVITAKGRGPAPEYHGPGRLYGTDGLLVQYGGRFDCPAATSGQEIQMEAIFTPSSLQSEEVTL